MTKKKEANHEFKLVTTRLVLAEPKTTPLLLDELVQCLNWAGLNSTLKN